MATFNADQAKAFLGHLWPLGEPSGGDGMVVVSWLRPGAVVQSAAGDTVELARRATEQGAHVWLNVATRKRGTTARGRAADCVSVPALWADLDVAEGAPEGVHRGGAVLSTYAEAHELLERMPLAPSLVVATGYGLSAWWLLAEPCPAEVAAPHLAALKATLTRLSDGRVDPSVYDVARMMRLPGTVNVKVEADPREVLLLPGRSAPPRYGLDDLEEAFDLPAAPVTPPRGPTAPGGAQERPGDDYSASMTTADVVALLAAHGATEVDRTERDGRLVVRMARPGKDARQGHSLTVGWAAEAVTHVFSSGWPELPCGTWTPFRLRAHLEYAADWKACARALAAEGYGARTAPLERLPELDDLHVARDFARDLGHDAIYVGGVGWLCWDGARYAVDTERHGVMRRLGRYMERLVARARIDAADEVDGAKDRLKKAHAYYSRGSRVKVLDDAAAEVVVDADELDAHPELLNCPNGVLDLRTGDLRDHDPSLRLTKLTDAEFADGAVTEDWRQALSAVTEDTAEYLRVAMGITAVGTSPADLVFVAFGSGGNGKGTMLGACSHALGDYATTVPARLFTDQGGRETQLLMPLRGARLAMAAETGEDHMLNMERLKALSGGDPITDRYLYSRSFATWAPSHTLWLQTNARPRVRNTDEGSWRRLQLVPFTSSYLAQLGNRDAGLRDRLRDDPANRSAVLAWIASGAREWLTEQAMPTCVEVDRANVEWRDSEDVIASFLADTGFEVVGGDDHFVGAKALYGLYREAALNGGQHPLSDKRFRAEMERYAFQRRVADKPTFRYHRTNADRRWVGLRQAADHASQRVEDVTPW